MNLFSFLSTDRRRSVGRSRNLTPAWEYRTRGIIWRLLFAEPGFIVGEDRDHEKRTVSFFCVDAQSGRALWNNRQFNELWWISIEAVYGNVVFLHEFLRPDFPDHHKIIAVDLATGKELWRNEDYKFLFAHQDCVYAMKEMFEFLAVHELDLHSGEILRNLTDQSDYVKVLRETAEAQRTASVEYPSPFDQGTNRQAVMTHIDSAKLRGEIEAIETATNLIFGFYQNVSKNPVEQELDQHLKILEKENGKLVFSDVITQKGKMPVPDLFFVHNHTLFYVKNQNTLKAVNLGAT